ncbi:D-alanyl-D-alanine carboxypeptidase family protein [Gorillibacterium sp. sgz5001074]|uniref:D-alanyl-D-alanine carboxypeptidase family protein n=1 Tax=Gorillibacterium sp. sgz5001074 TaxID=3446695 RepID=UPI003F67ABB6
MKKRIFVAVVALIVSLQLAIVHEPNRAYAAEAAPDLKLEVSSAILMDAATGQILYENNADVALPPASMAKMMTEYLVLEAIKSGKIKWEDMVPTSEYAAFIPGSGQLLAQNEKLSVKSMFEAMSIYSGNDASIALAEFIAGSEEEFANKINETAKKMGLSKDAHFINATGLNRSDMGKYAPKNIQGETLMTAKDAAIIAYNILKDHKEVLEFTKITSKKLRETDKTPMINWNWMLEGNKNNVNYKPYYYEGLDGLKTGHTDEAKYCFTGTAERNGMRLISVIMGAKTEPKRFMETRKLLDYGFNTFELKQVVQADAELDAMKTVEVKKAVHTNVPVVTEKALSILVKKGTKDDQIVKTAQPAEAAKLVAPVSKGDVLGKLTVTYNEQKYEVNLVAKEDVKKAGWFKLFTRSIRNFFVNLF